MMNQKKLLRKYYEGETSVEEEKILRNHFKNEVETSGEKDVFEYFVSENLIPADLEKDLFEGVIQLTTRKRKMRRRIYSISSVAAAFLIVLSIFLDSRNKRITKMESDFFVMEQALFQMSQGIQPEEQEDMLVLWVDDDVEIIIN